MSNQLIALALPPGRAFVERLQSAWECGDAVLPVDVRLPSSAQHELARRLGAQHLIGSSEQVSLPEAFAVEDGDALVMATSGTTGPPKGVVLTHSAITASAHLTHQALDRQKPVRWLACLPVAHIGGLSVIIRALVNGTELDLLETFDPAAVERAALDGATHVSLVATALKRVDPSLFDVVLLGGGPRPHEVPNNAVVTYGSTETGSGIVYDGKPLPGVELRTDSQDRLEVKSPTLLRCYRDGTSALNNGWFATGDAAEIDPEGLLHILGRFDDVIITGGEKVWPPTVEAALCRYDGIEAAVVFGQFDPEWGNRVVARIESEPLDIGSLKEFLKEQLPGYAVPKTWEFRTKLERTASGKLVRPQQP